MGAPVSKSHSFTTWSQCKNRQSPPGHSAKTGSHHLGHSAKTQSPPGSQCKNRQSPPGSQYKNTQSPPGSQYKNTQSPPGSQCKNTVTAWVAVQKHSHCLGRSLTHMASPGCQFQCSDMPFLLIYLHIKGSSLSVPLLTILSHQPVCSGLLIPLQSEGIISLMAF